MPGIFAIFFYLKTRRILLAVLTFSLLANLSLWINSGSRFFDINNLNWIVVFTKFYWPILNLALLIALVTSKSSCEAVHVLLVSISKIKPPSTLVDSAELSLSQQDAAWQQKELNDEKGRKAHVEIPLP